MSGSVNSSKSGPSTQSSSTQSSVPATPAPTSAETTSSERSIAARLEQIALDGARSVNERDFNYEHNETYKLAAPTFRAQFQNYPHPLTLEEHSNIFRQTIEEFPEYHVEVKSVSSEVSEKEGTAVVYLELELTGAPKDVKTCLINEFKWRKEGGIWMCYLHRMMKGMSEWTKDFNLL